MAPIKIQAMPSASNGYNALTPVEETISPQQKLINLLEDNIEQALSDYGKHTTQMTVLEDVSPLFIHQLATDAADSKAELREMMRKSPCWDENLQAWVINGNRTHNPDYEQCEFYATKILAPVLTKEVYDYVSSEEYENMPLDVLDEKEGKLREYHHKIRLARNWFTRVNADEEVREMYLKALQELAPDAYHEGRKVSKIFRLFCKALGILDESSGSTFQYWYAKLADELSSKQIDFKLFVSINPAHFVTMSNPKGDTRGSTLTSCHSFNATEYEYNVGCTGYARDNVTMIAFTVEDPSNAESLNNRKTSRQLYMYKPGNGVLLQSRMYNTGGGTQGAQEETAVYRDLIEREIAYCEGFNNLWTVKASSEVYQYVSSGAGFGGYKDWTYDYYDPHICVQKDFEINGDWKPYEIGTYGLCVRCGDEISEGMYCDDCRWENRTICDYCGEVFEDEIYEDAYPVYGANGIRYDYVCPTCLADYFTFCEDCECYYEQNAGNDVVLVSSIGRYVCMSCLEDTDSYAECDECGCYYPAEDMMEVHNSDGYMIEVCPDCFEGNYDMCVDCEDYYPVDQLTTAHDETGEEIEVCPYCLENNYQVCPNCGEYIPNWIKNMETCPCCGEILEKDEIDNGTGINEEEVA